MAPVGKDSETGLSILNRVFTEAEQFVTQLERNPNASRIQHDLLENAKCGLWKTVFSSAIATFVSSMEASYERGTLKPPDYDHLKPILQKWGPRSQLGQIDKEQKERFLQDLSEFSQLHPQWLANGVPLDVFFRQAIWDACFQKYYAKAEVIVDRLNSVVGIQPELQAEGDPKLNRLRSELKEHASSQHWGLYRNAVFQLGERLNDMGRWEEALCRYFEVCYLDLNGPKNYGMLGPSELAEGLKSFEPSDGELASGVLGRLDDAIAALNITPQEAKALFDETTAKLQTLLNLPVPYPEAWLKIQAEIY